MNLAAFVGDDQGALELAHILGVDSKVSLKRLVDVDTRRDIDERAATPHGRVQRRKLVVVRWDYRSEVLANQVRVLAYGRVHVTEQHAEALEVFAIAVKDNLGFVLRRHASQILALGLRNAEPFIGVLDGVGKILPALHTILGGLDVVINIVEVKVGHSISEPRQHGLLLEALEGIQSKLEHPWLFVLDA